MRNRIAQMLGIVIVIAVAIAVAENSMAQDVDAAFRLIPADAHAAAIIPNLKSLSDQITQCLEGMDRAEVLMGARPIDQFKAAIGFNTGVNDTGSLAIALARIEGGATALVFFIPVTDGDAFLRSNLTATEDASYALASGKIVYARSLGSHVAISDHAAAVQALDLAKQHETLIDLVGKRGVAIAAQGDLLILFHKEFISGAIAYANTRATDGAMAWPQAVQAPLAMAGDVESAVISIDFDPLGLIVRSFAKLTPKSRAAIALGEGVSAPPLPQLTALPNKPLYAAASWRLAALGDPGVLAEILHQANIEIPAALLSNVEAMQFAAYPSAVGVGGGILNDAALVLKTNHPALVVDSIRQFLLRLQDEDRVKREVKWEDERTIAESLTAATYQVKTMDMPPELMQQQMIEQALFGRAGFRGYVKQREDSVVVTFSHRAATLSAALDAGEDGLAASSTLRSLRRWLPPTVAMEAYVNLGHVLQFARAMVNSTSVAGDLVLPSIDPSLPPIAFGAGPAAGGAEHALVVPSGVLAAIFDQAMRQIPGSAIPSEDE